MKIRKNSGKFIITIPVHIVEALDLQVGDDLSFHLKDGNSNMIVLLRGYIV